MRRMSFASTYSGFAWRAVEVEDTTGSYYSGVWQEVMQGDYRTIKGIMLAEGPETLELYSDGSASSAKITVTTAARLWWADILAESQEQRQSYILWQGYRWRVMGNNLMIGNVDKLSIYTAERYIR